MEKSTHKLDDHTSSFPAYHLEDVDASSQLAADNLTNAFAKPYLDELFVFRHPHCQQYFEIEKDKLRLLFKMKQSIELCHDVTVAAIIQNPQDESLRNSLLNLQNQLQELQRKIDETVSNINSLSNRFKMRYGVDSFRINAKKNIASIRLRIGEMRNKGRKTLSILKRKRKHFELEKNGSRITEMVDLLNWAYQPSADDAGSLEHWEETAHQIQNSYDTLDEAVNAVVLQHILSDVKDEFELRLHSTPLFTNANQKQLLIMAIRVRMAGLIAALGGYSLSENAVKVGVYLCLLGSEAEHIYSQALGHSSPPFTMNGITQLPIEQQHEIINMVAARLTTKNAIREHDISRIPFMSGFVGKSLDAISTYGIANTAKALFLHNFKELERSERMEIARVHTLINMALVDEHYDEAEKSVIISLISALNISEQSKKLLQQEVDYPVKREVEYALFRGDALCSDSLLGSLAEIATADGQISPAEKLYLQDVGAELGYSETQLYEKFKL